MPSDTTQVLLQIVIESGGYQTFWASLQDSTSGATLWRSGDVSGTASGANRIVRDHDSGQSAEERAVLAGCVGQHRRWNLRVSGQLSGARHSRVSRAFQSADVLAATHFNRQPHPYESCRRTARRCERRFQAPSRLPTRIHKTQNSTERTRGVSVPQGSTQPRWCTRSRPSCWTSKADRSRGCAGAVAGVAGANQRCRRAVRPCREVTICARAASPNRVRIATSF